MAGWKIKAYNGTEPYVFISYAHKDTEIVQPIVADLRKLGFNIWFDEGIHSGARWKDVILSHLEACCGFIFFATENSLLSAECRKEIYYAAETLHKPFVNVVLGGAKLPGWFVFDFSIFQYVDETKFTSREAMVNKLGTDLKKLLSRKDKAAMSGLKTAKPLVVPAVTKAPTKAKAEPVKAPAKATKTPAKAEAPKSAKAPTKSEPKTTAKAPAKAEPKPTAKAPAKPEAKPAAKGSTPTYRRKGTAVSFGYYPQSLVTDEAIIAALGEYDERTWRTYQYYNNGETDKFMYYVDCKHKGESYRGVYMTAKRPAHTTDAVEVKADGKARQSWNGYTTNTTYWFHYEPIEWQIVGNIGRNATVVSTKILDSQEFYYRADDGQLRKRKDLESNLGNVYDNNYRFSGIRRWLAKTFYTTAFDTEERALIQTTPVDNSVVSTEGVNNAYVCEDTEDTVFLLSKQEFGLFLHGESDKQRVGTDYAKIQGLTANKETSRWWLRSPNYVRSIGAHMIGEDGRCTTSVVNDTRCGVVPVLVMKLSTVPNLRPESKGKEEPVAPVKAEVPTPKKESTPPKAEKAKPAKATPAKPVKATPAVEEVPAPVEVPSAPSAEEKPKVTKKPAKVAEKSAPEAKSKKASPTKSAEAPVPTKPSVGPTWVCANCGNNNPGYAQVCEVCGGWERQTAPKEPEPVAAPVESEPVEPEVSGPVWVCADCGNNNPGNVAVCEVCGSREHLAVAVEETAKEPKKTAKSEKAKVTKTEAPKSAPVAPAPAATPVYKLSADGKTLFFGSYPQTRVTNRALISALGSFDARTWKPFEYYMNGSVREMAYYIDKSHGGKRYRGVYIKEYRPVLASENMGDLVQERNGFRVREVYWFRYDPIEWHILRTRDGRRTLSSKMILDSREMSPYKTKAALTRTDYLGVEGEEYCNNYRFSTLRTWLNTTFLNTAFTEEELLAILPTEIKDDVAPGRFPVMRDQVYLLSRDEASLLYYADEARTKQVSDYAKSQGALVSDAPLYIGNGIWRLRSRYSAMYDYNATTVMVSGGFVDLYAALTDVGVAPSLCLPE
ncbi:MAG: TIR domain-containing protein [Clostridia bacterium]|nr:TIR domain-containing protein [Clostridia bacterium]